MRNHALLPLLASAALLFASCGDSSSSSSNGEGGNGDGSRPVPSASIAPWPGTAVAAYTLIADDFCGGLAGQTHADTMMANRGMGMAFGAMVGSCDDAAWAQARQMVSRGHEIINHSWSHMCGTTVERCGSGPTYGPEAFDQEYGRSTQSIEQNVGVRPTFFIFPYDESTDTARAYLRGLGYLGSRTGEKLKLNGDVFDPFLPNFDVNWPEGQKAGMQRWGFVTGLTDALVAQGSGWGIREIHGVDDGWGPIALDSMRAHADELKRLVDAGLLWVAPPSEVIKYHDQRNHYGVTVAAVNDTATSALSDVYYRIDLTGEPLDSRYDGRPLTIVLSGIETSAGKLRVEQGTDVRLYDKRSPIVPEDTIRVEFAPGAGPMTVRPAI